MAGKIGITIEGVDRVMRALERFPQRTQQYMSSAGEEAGKMIIREKGLQTYPPETAANYPPTPYYIRGRGKQYATHNDGKSRNLGKQFYVKADRMNTVIGNSTIEYAQYVIGDEQKANMARIGWRKLADVAVEKRDEITEIYRKWVAKLLRDLGL